MRDALTERAPKLFFGLSTWRKSGYPLSTTCCIRSGRHKEKERKSLLVFLNQEDSLSLLLLF